MGLTGWSLSRQTRVLGKSFSKQSLTDFPCAFDCILNIVTISLSARSYLSVVMDDKGIELLHDFLNQKTPSKHSLQAKICVVAKLRVTGYWEKTLLALQDDVISIMEMNSSHSSRYTKYAPMLGLVLHQTSWTY